MCVIVCVFIAMLSFALGGLLALSMVPRPTIDQVIARTKDGLDLLRLRFAFQDLGEAIAAADPKQARELLDRSIGWADFDPHAHKVAQFISYTICKNQPSGDDTASDVTCI